MGQTCGQKFCLFFFPKISDGKLLVENIELRKNSHKSCHDFPLDLQHIVSVKVILRENLSRKSVRNYDESYSLGSLTHDERFLTDYEFP